MDAPQHSFSLPVFPQNDRVSQDWSRVQDRLERLHDDFMSQWRQALSAIVPATVELDAQGMACQPYASFVKEAPAFSDIQVYEIESMQSLCAWSLDAGFVSGAVDSMFGGTGRTLASEVQRRTRSPIEAGIRRRLLESLATAYESVWQAVHPIRLNPLRQEALVSSLRLTASTEHVVHARFQVMLGRQTYSLALCLPMRALDILQPATPVQLVAATAEAMAEAPALLPETVPSRLHETPVEVAAMLGELQLTVAQLMSLSIGQVVPFQMNERIALEVDGVRVMSGHCGTRHGRHAVKVDLSAPVNLHGLKSDFTPLAQGLRALSDPEASAAGSEALPTDPAITSEAPAPVQNLDSSNHEPEPSE